MRYNVTHMLNHALSDGYGGCFC